MQLEELLNDPYLEDFARELISNRNQTLKVALKIRTMQEKVFNMYVKSNDMHVMNDLANRSRALQKLLDRIINQGLITEKEQKKFQNIKDSLKRYNIK